MWTRIWCYAALVALALSLGASLSQVNPMNAEFTSWRGAPPESWTAVRDRWEWGHVAVFSLKLVAYAALVWFAVFDRGEPDRARAEPLAP